MEMQGKSGDPTVHTAQPQTTTIPNVVVSPPVGPTPSQRTCSSCNANIITKIEYKSTTKTHLIALGLCCCGCCCCAWIPYYTKNCRNADHYCPNCDAYIGVYSS